MQFGSPHRHFRSTDSTNDRARELALAGAPSGTVVTAARQTAGRGRRGRAWSAPEGRALLLSAVLRPLGAEHALLPLAVPLAVCEAIDAVSSAACRIKWPNDIWLHERKVSGILIEARPPDWAVIGIGVNVAIEPQEFPVDLRWPATSIGGGVDVAAVREAVCATLGDWVARPRAELVAAFAERDALAGRSVSWEDGTGSAVGVDEDGNLLVDRDDGDRVALGSGEVSLRIDA